MALGHHLGAHEHPGGRGVEAAQHRAARARGGHVGVEPEHGQRPHQLLELPLELLRARPVTRHRRGPAVAAHRRHRLAVPAVVAGHLGGGAVQDERHVAVGALPHAAADAAREEVRPAAPVEEHDRLLLAAAHVVQGHAGALVKRAGHAQHAHELHRRQRAGRRRGSASRSALVAHDALRPRRGAAGEQHRALLGRPALGDHAGVVAGVALLLVRASCSSSITIRPRSSNGAKTAERGPTQTLRLATAHAPPLVVALACGEPRVDHRHGVAEALDEAAGGLRRQRDLGHEHDRRAAARERHLDGPEVDLGLAAAGDAVEQQRLPAAAACPSAPRPPRAPRVCVRSRLERGRPRRAPTALELRPP